MNFTDEEKRVLKDEYGFDLDAGSLVFIPVAYLKAILVTHERSERMRRVRIDGRS